MKKEELFQMAILRNFPAGLVQAMENIHLEKIEIQSGEFGHD